MLNLPSPTTPRISNLFITLPMLGIFMKTNSFFDASHRTWHQRTSEQVVHKLAGSFTYLFYCDIVNDFLKNQTQLKAISVISRYSNNLSYIFVQVLLKPCFGEEGRKNNRRKEPKMKHEQMYLTIFEMSNISTLKRVGGKGLTLSNS